MDARNVKIRVEMQVRPASADRLDLKHQFFNANGAKIANAANDLWVIRAIRGYSCLSR